MTGGWLAPMEAVLDALGDDRRVFFRDDDAGWDDASLRELLAVFDRHSVGFDIAVIPAALTPDLARWLERAARTGLVGLHQHGLAHENHEVDGRRCEFGRTRSYDEQLADIDRGRVVLGAALGPAVDSIFTPPWNRCTSDTGRALADLGFRCLSRDSSAAPLDGLAIRELPVTLDWLAKTNGRRWSRSTIGEWLATSFATDSTVGIMLHHAAMDDDDRAALDDLLAVLRTRAHVRPVMMRELI